VGLSRHPARNRRQHWDRVALARLDWVRNLLEAVERSDVSQGAVLAVNLRLALDD